MNEKAFSRLELQAGGVASLQIGDARFGGDELVDRLIRGGGNYNLAFALASEAVNRRFDDFSLQNSLLLWTRGGEYLIGIGRTHKDASGRNNALLIAAAGNGRQLQDLLKKIIENPTILRDFTDYLIQKATIRNDATYQPLRLDSIDLYETLETLEVKLPGSDTTTRYPSFGSLV